VSVKPLRKWIAALSLGVLMASGMVGCSSTPEETTDSSSTQRPGTIPGCDNAQNPLDCRLQNKKGGSDVPTVDNLREKQP